MREIAHIEANELNRKSLDALSTDEYCSHRDSSSSVVPSPIAGISTRIGIASAVEECWSFLVFHEVLHPTCICALKECWSILVSRQTSERGATDQAHEENRGHWGNKTEFLLATIGLVVGLGNIWRFSALAYNNGGSAFLIPYIILVTLFGLPTMFLEMAIGQYTNSGPSTVFRHYIPALQGIGWMMTCLGFTICVYYCLIVTWSFLYLLSSITGGIFVWSRCDNEWNDIYCIVRSKMEECKRKDPIRPVAFNGTCIKPMLEPMRTPFDQYFTNVITRRSGGIEDIGGINWPSFLTLMSMWVVIFLVLIKGYKYLGKSAYVTATVPYFIIIVLFLRAITLEGSSDGLYYYWGKPDFSKLLKHQTWSAALVQICFSINIGYGSVIMLASYNKKHNHCFMDAWIVVIGDFLMSVFGGATVFGTLGYLSNQLHKPIDEVVSSGHSLAFVAYPEAISRMPYPLVWSIFFYSMLFLLGLSSEIAFTETFCTSIYDQWPSTRNYKWLVSFSCCFVFFVCGIIFTTESGFFWFTVFDDFCASTAACAAITVEMLIIMHVYGYKNFRHDLIEMLGMPDDRTSCGPLSLFWKFTWMITAPILSLVVMISTLMRGDLSVRTTHGEYKFPNWALAFGWFLSLCPFISVPTCFAINYMEWTNKGKPLNTLFTIQPTLPSYKRIMRELCPSAEGVSGSKTKTKSAEMVEGSVP